MEYGNRPDRRGGPPLDTLSSSPKHKSQGRPIPRSHGIDGESEDQSELLPHPSEDLTGSQRRVRILEATDRCFPTAQAVGAQSRMEAVRPPSQDPEVIEGGVNAFHGAGGKGCGGQGESELLPHHDSIDPDEEVPDARNRAAKSKSTPSTKSASLKPPTSLKVETRIKIPEVMTDRTAVH